MSDINAGIAANAGYIPTEADFQFKNKGKN